MAKYGKKAQQKVKRAMHEYKEGSLRSGSGAKVTNPKQAIAIGLSEARKAGGKVPKKAKKASKAASKHTATKGVRKKTTMKKTGRKSQPRAKKTTRKTARRARR